MGSTPIFRKDDFGAPPVDEFIGQAYDTVRYVAENIEYIKHVSANLPYIYEVYNNIDTIKILGENIEAIQIIVENIDQILLVSGSIDNINLVANDIDALNALAAALPALLEIYENLPSLLEPVIITDDNPPLDNHDGRLWWKSDTGATYIWYEDGDSGQWVQQAGLPNVPENHAEILYGKSYGIVANGLTDDYAALIAAINASIEQKKKLILPNGVILVNNIIRYQSLATDAVIDIEGSGNTIIKAAPGLATTAFIIFGNSETVGPLSVLWPTTDGRTFVTENPTTDFAVNAVVGDSTFTVTDASTIPIGAVVKVKCQRLDVRGETRSYNCHGETNQVIAKSGNVLSLRYPVADNYSNDVFWTGTAIAGTARTITIATGLDTEKLLGCRVVVTTGGTPQTRYLTKYDPITGIAEIWADSSYPQDDFSPIPTAVSTVVIDQKPYLFWTPPFTRISLKAIEFEGNDTHVVERCLQISAPSKAYFADIGCDKIPVSFLHMSQCLSPEVWRPSPKNCNATNLGYGVLCVGSRDVRVYDPYAFNCRRFGPDSGGTTPTWGMTCIGGSVVGGVLDGDGVPWSETNPQGALGEHGQARNFTYDGMSVLFNVGNAGVQRGYNTTFRGIKSKGKATNVYSLSNGRNGRIIDCEHDGGLTGNANVSLPTDPEAMGHFVYTGSNWGGGGIEIRSCRMIDLTGDIVYVRTGALIPPGLDRFKGPIIMKDNSVDWFSATNRQLVNAYSNISWDGFDIDIPLYTIKGGGSANLYGNGTAFSAGVDSHSFKLNGVHRVSITQDKICKIQLFVNQNQIAVRAMPITSTGNNQVNAIFRKNSTTIIPNGTTSTNIKASATAPTGTTGAVGDVTFHLASSGLLTIENRFAGEINWMMELVSY